MKRITLRAVSVALLLAMAVSTASCVRKTNKRLRKISEDSPWFDSNIIEVDTGAEKGRAIASWILPRFIGSNDKYCIIETSGYYQNPPFEEIDWKTYDFNDYVFDYIAVVDRNSNQTVNTIDLRKDLTVNEPRIDNVYFNDGLITARSNLKERDYDPLSGELLDTRPCKTSNEDSYTAHYSVGEYEIETIVYQIGPYYRYSTISVKSPDGNVKETELKKADKSIYIKCVLAASDNKVVIPASVGKYGDEIVYYELDLVTNELTVADSGEYEWLDDVSFYDCICSPDGMIYFKNEQGIFRVNAKLKKAEKILDYNQCCLNRGLIDRFELVECSEDRFLLCGLYDITSAYEGRTGDKANLIELTRADKNPHKDKTVLELFSPKGIDSNTGDAVARFNEANGKFFIEYSSRYDRSDYANNIFDENNEDVSKVADINTGAVISNKLAIDIMNGDAPDILLDCSSYSRLYNSNCLADLTPFVKDADPEKYFTNIIEGSKTGDAIYQLPVSFVLEGIMTKASKAGSSGKGFTLDEYVKFTDEVMNGNDPICYGQAVYFSMIFNSMREEFISNGKVDLSKPEFRMLADYVKDNVREKGISVNDFYQAATVFDCQPSGQYDEFCTGIGGFFTERDSISPSGKGVTLLGIPSLDGRGPRFIPDRSVAISAQAVDVKACGEFVKLLLSDEFQTKIALNDAFVINREAFKKAASAAVEYYNGGGSSAMGDHGFSSGPLFDRDLTSKDLDLVENIILSCSKIKSEDPDISIILIEEMPAYFLGQKDLDAVIKIAENRIQNLLDERG